MDLTFLYRGQRFSWNVVKAAGNFTKHGIAFEMACQVFFDPLFLVEDASDEDEIRDAVVGFTEDRSLLYVVNILREDDSIRIISARRATAQERKAYEDGR